MKNITFVKNAQIVLENGILWDGAIILSGDVICTFGKERDMEVPTGAEIIDAGGSYVGPGFVDIHVHAGSRYSTCLEAKEAAEFLLSHGETSLLATSRYRMNLEDLIEAIRLAKEGMKTAKNIKGIYFEGPYINPHYGAFAEKNPWRHTINPDEFKKFVDEAGTAAKVWVIAPEREGILPFAEYARKVNPNVIFAVGHSEATPEQIRALGAYKPRIQTHSMNATGRLPVYGGTRGYGPDEYAFCEPDIYCELISDSCGIHVHPDLQKLLLHNKGLHRTLLITDGTYSKNPPPENLKHITDLNFESYGGISGSKLTMDVACRNVMANTNCGIAQAFMLAATTPSRAIGMDDEIGSIEVGKKADLVFVDDRFNVKKVMLGGKLCC